MLSTALNRILASTALAFVSVTASAADAMPPILTEPVFGLRYETARVKFDPLPLQAIANCESLADDGNRQSIWYVYGEARDASGRTYYVTGGYDIRKDAPPHLKYETGDSGLIFFTDRGKCTPLDAPRETFNARLFDDEMSPPVLKQLALDVVRRLERAYGGPERLQRELRSQHIDLNYLPPELDDAMKSYTSH